MRARERRCVELLCAKVCARGDAKPLRSSLAPCLLDHVKQYRAAEMSGLWLGRTFLQFASSGLQAPLSEGS